MKSIISALLLILFPLTVGAVEPLKVTYGLYAGGFNVVEIDGTYTVTDTVYDLNMNLKTAGMLGTLAPWAGVLNSDGVNKGAQSTPLNHNFASTWRGDTENTVFVFNKDGTLKSHNRIKSDGEIIDKMPPDDVLVDTPTDMLSAMFRVMNNPTCETTQPALDGKRRFDMAFRSQGKSMVKKSKYSAFEGEAEICEVEIIPVAGKWREKKRGWMSIQEQAKDNGQLPRLWFGKVRDDMPPIPVRFQIKTNYGTMIMHLKDINS